MPLRISTIADAAEEGYWLDVECKKCKRSERIEPKELVQAGYGSKSITSEFRCTRCGKRAESRLHAPAPRRD